MTTKTFYSEPVCLLKEEGQGIGECVSEDFYSDIDISTMYSTKFSDSSTMSSTVSLSVHYV